MPSSPAEQSARDAVGDAPTLRTPIRVVARQLAWFTAIGVVMTGAYLALYAVLRLGFGPQTSNLVSWVATAVADTSANRRFTFGVHGRAGAVRAQLQGLVVFALGLAITSGSIALLEAAADDPGQAAELVVLAVANIGAGLLRFVLLRVWVFPAGR